jgi:hypothetical protein
MEDLALSPDQIRVAERLHSIFVDHSQKVARHVPFRLTVQEIAEVRDWIKSVNSRWEEIDFDRDINPKCLRKQRLLWKNYTQRSKEDPKSARLWTPDELQRKKPLPPCLERLFKIILAWHGTRTLFVLKLIKSLAGCNFQHTHTDCPEMRHSRRVIPAAAQFEGMIALEPDTNRTAIVVGDKEYIIPQGQLHVWKGTFPHSGACYFEDNERLFMCMGSFRFPMSLFVGFPDDDGSDSDGN